MAQPAALFLARSLTRSIPFTSQKTFNITAATFPASNSIGAAFDVGLGTTDRNQLLGGIGGAAPTLPVIPLLFTPIVTQFAIGFILDALIFSTNAGLLTVQYAVDSSCTYRTIATSAVVAGNPSNVSGLRVTGRFARIFYTDSSGLVSSVELGLYLRSI